jgi:hypothetical protein
MSGKHSFLSPLESEKQLLIAESELNRVQMVGDIDVLSESVHQVTTRARSFGSIVSSAVMLMAGLAKPIDAGAKIPWIQTLLKGVGIISTLWVAFHPQKRDQKDK